MKRNRCISSLTPGGDKQKLRHSSWQFRIKEQKAPAGRFVGNIWEKGAGWSPGTGGQASTAIGIPDSLGHELGKSAAGSRTHHSQVIKKKTHLFYWSAVGRSLLQNWACGPVECEGRCSTPSDASTRASAAEPCGGLSSPLKRATGLQTVAQRGPWGPTPWQWQRASPPQSCHSLR